MLACDIVMKSKLMSRPQDPAAARLKIAKAWEIDARLKPLQGLIESWNKWRIYYLPEDQLNDMQFAGRWCPKNSSQVSACETLLEFANENNLDLDLLVACGHKSFEKSRYHLTINMLISHGLEYYSRYAEDVRVDLDEDEYRVSASDCWDAELG